MKTSIDHQIHLEQPSECDFCHAEEGKHRPVGNFIVELQMVILDGQTKHACQSCIHKQRDILKARERHQHQGHYQYSFNMQHLKKVAVSFLHLGIVMVVFSNMVMAQPPGLPGSPDQAPIDGGLGLLAAAGGAYAWKKLRDRKEV